MLINSLLRIKISQCYLGGNGTAVKVDIYFPPCTNAASSQIAVLLYHPMNITRRPPLNTTKCNSPRWLISPPTPAQTCYHARPHCLGDSIESAAGTQPRAEKTWTSENIYKRGLISKPQFLNFLIMGGN